MHAPYRNPVGLAPLVPVLFFLIVLGAMAGLHVLTKQRLAESRHRVESMRAEIARLDQSIQSLTAQQAALLSREALKGRLKAAGSKLVPIEHGQVREVVVGGWPSGMAMNEPEGGGQVAR